jgi:alkanesulfonate monooxygenase SsuD/methylene tetrahydromethanopterin reductase-like flavin-dependent oxidoreductase (luciferase family)
MDDAVSKDDAVTRLATPSFGRPLKVGFQLPEIERPVSWNEVISMARLGEEVGFDSVWVSDHLLYRDLDHGSRAPLETWTSLAGIAASTERIAIGPLVACTSFHNPTVLAKFAASVDEISGGRLILGLGAGWNEVEYQAFGFSFDRRVSRFEEAFTIIRSLLRDGQVDFAGEFYTARECELVPRARPGGPPLLVGSIGQRMLRITLPYVSAWNAWFSRTGNRPEGVRPLREKVDVACRAVGRDPREVERTLAVLVQPPGLTRVSSSEPEFMFPAIEGSATHIAEELSLFAQEGIGHVQLVLDPITEASIEAMAPVLARLDVMQSQAT